MTPVGVVDGEPGEHRLGEPLVDERLDSDLLEVPRLGFVVGDASVTIRRVGETGGATDEHEPFDLRRAGACRGEGVACAHRVTDVRACAGERDESAARPARS